MAHDRLGRFNTRDTYPEQRLDNDLCQVVKAGVLVADRQSWSVVDLRVDWQEKPIAAVRALWAVYAPQLEAYVTRALDPDAAPGF